MLKKNNNPKKELEDFKRDYEMLAKMLQDVVETGYLERNKIYKMSFIKGVVTGFGGVIGATVVVALLLWSLSLFEQVPLINRLTENVQTTIEQK